MGFAEIRRRPAGLLSGGLALGVHHFGVVKALWEADMLPVVCARPILPGLGL